MKSRLLILVAAILLGVTAAFMTVRYLDDATARLNADAEPVQVMVATQDVPRGMTAEEMLAKGYATLEEVPRRYVADGAVSAMSTIEGKVLATSLSSGEQLTMARFRYPSAIGLSYSIPEGFVAMSISANDVKCVGGMLKPGDFVLVVVTLEPGPAEEGAETQILLSKVRVLAVGVQTEVEPAPATSQESQTTGLVGSTEPEQRATAVTITLALSPADVEKLVFAEEQGSVRLALLPATATDVPVTTGRTLQSIFE
ncbi:MAG: Flp pilus assembly protein CpaB [Coriobacteriia bacterium]|nr:Flp pilus assembly protein CpaB [Coriobacteriia bacterium]